MREICQSGSEGGASQYNGTFLPLSYEDLLAPRLIRFLQSNLLLPVLFRHLQIEMRSLTRRIELQVMCPTTITDQDVGHEQI